MRRLRRFLAIAYGVLRELSDESAYTRHLARHGLEPSADEWRRFSDTRLAAKYGRPRCC